MDAGPLPQQVFRNFVFDPARGALFGADGVEVTLRPKSLALLRHMMGNAGRLVAREELLDAVWPGVFVSDDSITQCVGEIRRALGSDGATILRTVPKRGYLFDVPIEQRIVDRRPSVAAMSISDSEPRPGASLGVPPPSLRRNRLVAIPVVLVLLGLSIGAYYARQPAVALQPVPAAAPLPMPGLTPQQDEARRLYQAGSNAFYSRIHQDGWLAARALYEKAIAADPSYAPPYAGVAFTYTNVVAAEVSADPAADLDRGEAMARRAISLGADLGISHAALGGVLRLRGKFAEALDSYRQAVALDPLLSSALANSGLMLIYLGRPDEALTPIRAAMKLRPLSPDFVMWQFYLGMAQMFLGQDEFGAAALRASLDPPVLALLTIDARRLYLAAALALAGHVQEARGLAAETTTERTSSLTIGWFRAHPLSDNAAYLARAETLCRGLALAGIRE